MIPTSEERKHTELPWRIEHQPRGWGNHTVIFGGSPSIEHENCVMHEHSPAKPEDWKLIVTAVNSYYTLTEQNAKLLAQIEDLKAELKNEIEQAEAVDYRVEDHNSLKEDNQKLREALREAKFALEWHFNNSKPIEDSGHSDFFNLTANALTQIESLLEESKPLNS